MIFRTTSGAPGEPAAVVELSADEARLVDVLILLHECIHKRDTSRPLTDPERGDMVIMALLQTGRSLTGWSDDLLRAYAAGLGADELRRVGAALTTLAKATCPRPIEGQEASGDVTA